MLGGAVHGQLLVREDLVHVVAVVAGVLLGRGVAVLGGVALLLTGERHSGEREHDQSLKQHPEYRSIARGDGVERVTQYRCRGLTRVLCQRLVSCVPPPPRVHVSSIW